MQTVSGEEREEQPRPAFVDAAAAKRHIPRKRIGRVGEQQRQEGEIRRQEQEGGEADGGNQADSLAARARWPAR